jgi:hypothetical protein
MKKIWMLLATVLLLSAINFFACGDDDDDDDNDSAVGDDATPADDDATPADDDATPADDDATPADDDTDVGSGGGAGVEALVDGVKVSCPKVLAAGKNPTTVNINAVQASGGYPVFQITIAASGGVIPGTAYDCTVANNVAYVDVAGTVFTASATAGACSVTFTEIGNAVGAAVRGTFSATVLDSTQAETLEITEGVIDVVLISS